MNVTAFLTDQLARYIVGGTIWAATKTIVVALENEKLSGAEKWQIARDRLIAIGYELESFVINLIIELAVAWARSKVK